MLNLGQLQFVLGINTRALDDAFKSVEAFAAKVGQVQTRANKGLDTQIGAYRRVENSIVSAGEKLNTFAHKVENSKLTPEVKADLIRKAEQAWSDASQMALNYKKVTDSTNLDRSMAGFKNAMGELGREYNVLIGAEKELAQASKAASAVQEAAAKRAHDQFEAFARLKMSEAKWAETQQVQATKAAANAEITAAKAAHDKFEAYARLKADQAKWAAQAQAAAAKSASAEEVTAARKAFDQFNAFARLKMDAYKAQQSAEETTAKAALAAASKREAAFVRQEKLLNSSIEKAKNLDASINRSGLEKGTPELSDRIQVSVNKLKTALSGPEPLKPREFAAASAQYTAQLGQIRRDFQQLKSEANSSALGLEAMKRLKAQMQQLGSTMLLINGHLGGMSTRMFALGSIVGEAGVAVGLATGAIVGLGVGLKAVITGSLQAAMKIERAERALQAVTGSAAMAAHELKFVREASDQAGSEFTQTATAYARFDAASKAAGQTMAATHDQFRVIALAAGSLSLSVEDTGGVFRAFEQILSKGKVQSEELRGQLGDRLPAAFAIAAKAMGTTTAELSDMMKKGEVLSAEFVPKFIEAIKQAYNIDVSKPIDTLQAALNRAGNSVTGFYDAFARNTHILEAAKKLLDVFSRTLNYLERNMEEIIRTSAQVAGAMAGAAVATASWTAAIIAWNAAAVATGAITTFVANVRAAVALIAGAKTVTEAWTVATMALNTALTAAPWGKVIALIARLVFTIGGAIIGYKLMTKWLNSSSTSFDASLASIQGYISAQKALGYQVRSVTNDLIKQAKALAITAAADTRQKTADLKATKRPGILQKAANRARGIAGVITGEIGPAPNDMTGGGRIQARRVQDAEQALKDSMERSQLAAKAIRELIEVSKLPDEMPNPEAAGGLGSDKDTKGRKDNIKQVLKMLNEYETAMTKIANSDKGPEFFEMQDSINKARDALEEMSPKQLAKIDVALREAGFASGTLEERMAQMQIATDKANKSIGVFVGLWEDFDTSKIDLGILGEQMVVFEGGGSSDAINDMQDNLRLLGEAKKAIKDLSAEQMPALTGRLREMGLSFQNTGNAQEDLLDGMVALGRKMRETEQQVALLNDVVQETENILGRARDAIIEIASYKLGMDDDERGRWIERNQLIADFAQKLYEANVPVGQMEAALRNLNLAFDSLDEAEKFKKLAEEAATFKESAARAFADFAGEALTNFNNIFDAAKGLLNRLQQLFMEQFVVQPIFESLKGMFGKMNFPGLKGDDPDNMAALANSTALATQQITQLGLAAQQVALQMGSSTITSMSAANDNLGVLGQSAAASAGAMNTQVISAQRLGDTFTNVGSQLLSMLSGMSGGGGGFLGTVLGIASSAFGGGGINVGRVASLTGDVTKTIAANPAIFALGGLVRGPGTSTSDSISARLSDGEFVMNAKAVKRWGVSTLEAMNSNEQGPPQKFARGGFVSRIGKRSADAIGSFRGDGEGFGDTRINATFNFPNATNAREIRESEGQAGRRLRRTVKGSIRGR